MKVIFCACGGCDYTASPVPGDEWYKVYYKDEEVGSLTWRFDKQKWRCQCDGRWWWSDAITASDALSEFPDAWHD